RRASAYPRGNGRRHPSVVTARQTAWRRLYGGTQYPLPAPQQTLSEPRLYSSSPDRLGQGVLWGDSRCLTKFFQNNWVVADREGFEPSVGFHLHTLSKRARSTTPPPVRFPRPSPQG